MVAGGAAALPVRLGSVLGLSFGIGPMAPSVFPDDSFPGERCDRGAGPPKNKGSPALSMKAAPLWIPTNENPLETWTAVPVGGS